MAPRRKKSTPALEDFPKSLRMAIARVMARFNLDYPEALERAAQLIDINGRVFKEEVEREAEKRYKSRFMTQLNKARGTIEKNVQAKIDAGYQRGYAKGCKKGKSDHGIWYPCVVCNQPIYIKPSSESHRLISEFLRSSGWGHSSCHDKRASR